MQGVLRDPGPFADVPNLLECLDLCSGIFTPQWLQVWALQSALFMVGYNGLREREVVRPSSWRRSMTW